MPPTARGSCRPPTPRPALDVADIAAPTGPPIVRRLGATLGITAVLHTWTRELRWGWPLVLELARQGVRRLLLIALARTLLAGGDTAGADATLARASELVGVSVSGLSPT